MTDSKKLMLASLARLQRQRQMRRLHRFYLTIIALWLILLCLVASNRCGGDGNPPPTPVGVVPVALAGFYPLPLGEFSVSPREFCVRMVRRKGQAEVAEEIADAIIDTGLPLLPLDEREGVCLLLAVIDVESDFRLHVIGDEGRSVGLMQWQYRLYAKYSGCQKFDKKGRTVWSAEYHEADVNVLAGATVLSHRLAHADLWLAVSRYNSPGARRVNDYGRRVRRDYRRYMAMWADYEPPMTRL